MTGPSRRLGSLVLVGVAIILVALAAYKPTARRLTRTRGEHLTRPPEELQGKSTPTGRALNEFFASRPQVPTEAVA